MDIATASNAVSSVVELVSEQIYDSGLQQIIYDTCVLIQLFILFVVVLGLCWALYRFFKIFF